MARQMSHDRTTGAASRRRLAPLRPGAVGLVVALSAALTIPALTIAGGAATAAGPAPFQNSGSPAGMDSR